MFNEVVELINSKVSGANAIFEAREVGDSVIFVDGAKIFDVCKTLKESDPFRFNVLQAITGTDYPEYIEVSYIIASFITNNELILKTKLTKPVDGTLPVTDSVVAVWSAANYQERECFDMLGVRFHNHPDHRRILCPDDWEGYPLRKDYKPAATYRSYTINPESKMNVPERQFAEKQKAAEAAKKAAADAAAVAAASTETKSE